VAQGRLKVARRLPERLRTVLAAAVAAPWVGWALLRLLGLDLAHPLVGVIAFTPYAAATSVVPVLAAVVLRRWAVALVAALACAVLVVAVAPRALGGPEQVPSGAATLTVVSTNLFVGNADAEAVVGLAEREGADVVSLQEVTPEASERLDEAGLDAWPVRAQDTSWSAVVARGRARAVPSDRAVLAVQAGGSEIQVEAVHPVPPISTDAVRSWEASLRRLPAAGRGVPRVLAGDFNATLDHRELQRLLGMGYRDAAEVTGRGLHPTWPVGRRVFPLTIDHVLADERLAVVRYEVRTIPGTDHRALVAEVALRP
jgi:endonuclease/exonuclease/phosphatase (EEP) superfamily protein YafD